MNPSGTIPNYNRYKANSANPVYHFAWGVRFFFAGLRMLFRQPALLALSLIPIALTVLLLLALAFGCVWLVGQSLAGVMPADYAVFAQAIILVLALLLSYFLYLPVARVLLAPFAEAISRKAHSISTGESGVNSDISWTRAIKEGLKISTLHLVVGVFAFALNFLPPVGPIIGLLIVILLCGLEFLDVPLSVRGIPFGKKLGVIWQNKSAALGFGAASYLMLLIPGINLLSLPVGVIGATLLTNQFKLES
ncbi:MAG: EI24 domain-containing protein [Acidobacteria bacterium]|nr:EI24 domain-containing protein [Acidobacteriota bacterium]